MNINRVPVFFLMLSTLASEASASALGAVRNSSLRRGDGADSRFFNSSTEEGANRGLNQKDPAADLTTQKTDDTLTDDDNRYNQPIPWTSIGEGVGYIAGGIFAICCLCATWKNCLRCTNEDRRDKLVTIDGITYGSRCKWNNDTGVLTIYDYEQMSNN